MKVIWRVNQASSWGWLFLSSRNSASADPPLHLVLGKIGVKRVRDELHDVLRSIDAWAAVSRAADFPEA